MKRLLPAILMFCCCLPCLAQKQPVNAIDTTTLINGKTIVIYSNKTWKYIEQPKTAQVKIPFFGNFQAENKPVEEKISNTLPAKATKSTSSYLRPTYSSSTSSHQCHATTKKGTQCSRMAVNGYNCWQHGG